MGVEMDTSFGRWYTLPPQKLCCQQWQIVTVGIIGYSQFDGGCSDSSSGDYRGGYERVVGVFVVLSIPPLP